MKKAFLFSLLVVSSLLLPVLAKRMTYGFKLAKLRIHEPFQEKWERQSRVQLDLPQDFTFLGKGAQSYVFQSKGGAFVLKLFRSDHGSVAALFDASILAFDRAQKETGLLYLHLNATKNQLPVIRLHDAVGRIVRVPLDNYRFALQEKALDLETTLWQAKDQPEKMERRIKQILQLLQTRAEKNIVNTDPSLLRNFGFLEDRAIEIDFGNFRMQHDVIPFAEVKRYAKPLRKWLKKKHLNGYAT